MTHISPLESLRRSYMPSYPTVLSDSCCTPVFSSPSPHEEISEIEQHFPLLSSAPFVHFESGKAPDAQLRLPCRIAVLLSGGQAPGGHNIIAGLWDALQEFAPESRLFGFQMGMGGLLRNKYIELTQEKIDEYRNTGGFDLIGSDRTKLTQKEQYVQAVRVLQSLQIDALVVVGGDDSNTNAALLAEYLLQEKVPISVVGCPKTIDGDLKNAYIETSFGFDTCSKLYSELIGNVQRDCLSAKKYWHFIKLMGRSASHITLECALKTHPNVTILSEEVVDRGYTLDDIINYIADSVVLRSDRGMNYGIVLIPEGLIEFIPRMKRLIAELNDVLHEYADHLNLVKESMLLSFIASQLSAENEKVFTSLPEEVARQMTAERDPHGNVQVSRIQTEELLAIMVAEELRKRKEKGLYQGTFSTITHFFGYEGRCAMPSNFDADYCYALGRCAARLAQLGQTGCMATIAHLIRPRNEWQAIGVPLTRMMRMEQRQGSMIPVVEKSLVDVEGAPFLYYKNHRMEWIQDDCYSYPGPIQFFGPEELTQATTITLQLEHQTIRDY